MKSNRSSKTVGIDLPLFAKFVPRPVVAPALIFSALIFTAGGAYADECKDKPTQFQCNDCCTELAISVFPSYVPNMLAGYWVPRFAKIAADLQAACYTNCQLAANIRAEIERKKKILENLRKRDNAPQPEDAQEQDELELLSDVQLLEHAQLVEQAEHTQQAEEVQHPGME